jgi:hypothetical protein
MGFSSSNTFKTESRKFNFVVGYGLIIELVSSLPRYYDEALFGGISDFGMLLTGTVVKVLGKVAVNQAAAPVVGSVVSILVRPSDPRMTVFDALEKTGESSKFLLEGVTSANGDLTARWAHGAGSNRYIRALPIVSAPHVSFENPYPEDGARNGWLTLNLDGAPSTFDVFESGNFVEYELAFDDVVKRLEVALDKDMKFIVSQHVLFPDDSRVVNDQMELETALTEFRKQGLTGCVVRSFVKNTSDAGLVDVQYLNWPVDVPVSHQYPGMTYKMPVLQETKRFVSIRDGEADAEMEIIPGMTLQLIGNKDSEKSTKHNFIRRVIKGLSVGQKSMYGSQTYGPGIGICAVGENSVIGGLVRLAVRTDGEQYKSVVAIPSPNFSGLLMSAK